ncbi:hypothetical protein MPTK1_2g17370 [Marchantia polymorpha subsp. ruderalis]|uniref:Uncharacterized protein n=1 Tax=Marchantia polymorpha TaxID=3197 RepID=A0A2R6WG54_MARPO|nr:hypothetical protein MARPO_0094s0005 [Marchantia polymorpha]BBN02700.1 hypothetical protein Mp_2g17370 [Marchantia polymorpha subsp. ruderalis]|eukprot:PTQ32823.1 hypothetical protein MARPO_0094s0005 [Marchantia polymorpha]
MGPKIKKAKSERGRGRGWSLVVAAAAAAAAGSGAAAAAGDSLLHDDNPVQTGIGRGLGVRRARLLQASGRQYHVVDVVVVASGRFGKREC